ncbi:cytosine permease [Emcibacter nanhaiensis]|uniref:Cytosine permease n=1 Tax=Emcibacter nanhaiensis TaxID=1505037 RepID=A0A501PG96_9PROT|nr:cytosine permease [Emcibacter nanhaiensis]TPD59001.1 hypothetical protein FIV46_12250 [Emcibacter nanhaiensis]
MSDFDQLTEDYSRHRVPEGATVSGIRIATVMFGAIVTLPIFLVGTQLGQKMGLYSALWAFLVVGLVVGGIAVATGIVATRSRMTTALIMQYAFGCMGARIVSGIMAIAMLGWYGVTIEVFVDVMQQLMQDMGVEGVGPRVYLFGASALMILTAIFGFRGLDRVSLFAVPVMVVFLVLLVYRVINMHGLEVIAATPGQGMTVAQGASAGIGGFIVGVTLFPDLCRYARSVKDAVIAAGIGLGLCATLVLIFTAIPSIAFGETNFLTVVLIAGIGLPGIFLILLATWTTNAYNLYSSSLIFANIIRQVTKWKLVVALGLVGTLLALSAFLSDFIGFLSVIAITIPPVAGIYLADFYIVRRQNYSDELLASLENFRPEGFAAWCLGSLVAYFSSQAQLVLTTVAALDAILVAFLGYVGLVWVFGKLKKPRLIYD